MELSEIKTPGKYDRKLYLQSNTKSAHFDQINFEIIQELFNRRPNFGFTKDVAIARLEKIINDQLNILTLDDDCDHSNMEELSKHVFTWSGRKFLQRRVLKNSVWIDVLMLHAKEDCLERFKLQTDLSEIKAFIKSTFRGLQKSQATQDSFDLETFVYMPLRQAEENLDILSILHNENEKLKATLHEHRFRIHASLFAKRTTKEQLLLFGMEETVLNTQTSSPVKTRFEINWCQCQIEQDQFKSDLAENYIRRKIDEYKSKIFSEDIAGDTIRDTYYALAEQYKNDVDVLQNNYNIQLDEIENKICYTKLEISKLVDQRNFLSKQIERFRKEIENRLEKEKKQCERKELERVKLLEEEGKSRSVNRKNKIGSKRKLKQKPKKT